MKLIILDRETQTLIHERDFDGRYFYIPRKDERFCIGERRFTVDYHAMDYETCTMTLEVTEKITWNKNGVA